MSVEVATNDASAVTDTQLDEMASLGGAFDIGAISKAREEWVLSTTARIGSTLHGFAFSTLERIGGTPCVLIGMMSTKRHAKRETVLRGLMKEAFHRALMAFPDEDVVVGSRFVSADAMVILKDLDDVTPRPGARAVGEERAWGRRLAKRFGVDASYEAESFTVVADGRDGFVDHEALKPEKVSAAQRKLLSGVDDKRGGVLIAYGWTMAEDLVKLGAR